MSGAPYVFIKKKKLYVFSIYALRVPTLLAASKNVFMLLFYCRTAMVGCLSENQSRQLNTSRYVCIPRYISRFVTTVGPCSNDLSVTYTYILGNEKFLQSQIFAGAPLQCISKIVCRLHFCGSLPCGVVRAHMQCSNEYFVNTIFAV